MLDVSRVQKELVEIERDKHLSGVSISICKEDLARMRGTITGPHGTPYEGGIFSVDIHLPCTSFFTHFDYLFFFLFCYLRECPSL
jgi:ubiquitin-conjugating enzyme (huntingtin interacting protein 2)